MENHFDFVTIYLIEILPQAANSLFISHAQFKHRSLKFAACSLCQESPKELRAKAFCVGGAFSLCRWIVHSFFPSLSVELRRLYNSEGFRESRVNQILHFLPFIYKFSHRFSATFYNINSRFARHFFGPLKGEIYRRRNPIENFYCKAGTVRSLFLVVSRYACVFLVCLYCVYCVFSCLRHKARVAHCV